jgi:hypothetical protein
MSKGAYLAKTKGGTQTSNLPTNFSSVSSNQGGGPAGMTFQEAASVQTPGGGIMSQQEAQQAQQQINQNQPATTPQGESAEDIKKRLEEERIKKQNESAQQQVLNMLFGAEGDTSVKKSAFEKSGKHPLRAQLDYLIGKYGDSVLDTEQGKVLMGYLSGVPVERGGGLGAFDSEEGTGGAGIDPNDPGEKVRRDLLEGIASGEYNFTMDDFIDPKIVDYMRGRDIKGAQELTPEQYFKFRQQLMAADPTAENQGYKDAFPFSSGAGLGAMAERFMPGATAMSALAGGILPERNMTGYQGFDEDPLAATFRALPESQDRASSVMSTPAFTIAQGQDAPPKPGPGFTPDAPTGPSFTPQTTSPFDLSQFYAGLPNYSYGQQGVMNPNINPDLAAYFENLKKYYGVG